MGLYPFAVIDFHQPERGTKRKKEAPNGSQNSGSVKKRPIAADADADADAAAGSGLSEEERLKILEMVENEPEVSGQYTSKLACMYFTVA